MSILGDNRQTSALDDVQLFAYVSLATHEVSAGPIDIVPDDLCYSFSSEYRMLISERCLRRSCNFASESYLRKALRSSSDVL